MIPKLLSDVKSPQDKEAIAKAAKYLHERMKEENKSLQEILQVNGGLLEDIYSLGYGYYNQGRYKEASSLFYMLSHIDPTSYKYLFGLASSLHQQGDYENAAYGYCNAVVLDPENPYPFFYLSDCCLKGGDPESAIEALDFVLEIAEKKEGYRQLKERSILLKEGLEKQIAVSKCKK